MTYRFDMKDKSQQQQAIVRQRDSNGKIIEERKTKESKELDRENKK